MYIPPVFEVSDLQTDQPGSAQRRCIFQKSGGAPLDANLADRRGRAPSLGL